MGNVTLSFNQDETKKIQDEVRNLFLAMPDDLREHVLKSFLWTQDVLENYLSRDIALEGNELKEAYSHLESLLARIEGLANEKPAKPFPGYEQWVTEEYKQYKTSLHEDKEDIERLMDEGGIVAPGETSPVDVMADDSLSHYNHLKSEHEKAEKRSQGAIALMRTVPFKNLQKYATKMCKAIVNGAHR
jgi:hypothetical protein